MKIKIGDVVKTDCGGEWVVFEEPRGSGLHPDCYSGIKKCDTPEGLFPMSEITHVNGKPVNEQPIDLERLSHDRAYWDEVAPEGATCYGQADDTWLECWYKMSGSEWVHMLAGGSNDKWENASVMPPQEKLIPRPDPAWNGEGLPLESTSDFRKALAMNLQQSIKAITGYVFPDDESLILAHELMGKYDLSEKL